MSLSGSLNVAFILIVAFNSSSNSDISGIFSEAFATQDRNLLMYCNSVPSHS